MKLEKNQLLCNFDLKNNVNVVLQDAKQLDEK